MLFAKEVLQKYAARKKDENFESSMTPQAQRERELIRQAQNGNFMSYRQLLMDYRNVINSAISSSGLTTVMDHKTSVQEANKAFKQLIMKNYDLTKQIQPNTYIMNTLPKVLSKVKYTHRDFAGRKSDELTRYSETLASGRNMLRKELGREPSVDEVYGFIQNNMQTAKSMTKDHIRRIDALDRKELSGNVQIGSSDNTSGADFITLSDITNISKQTPEQIYESSLKNQRIEEIINKLPKIERRFIRNFYGIGEFKNKKADNLYSASVNNGMSYYEAKKTIDKFKEMLKSEGIL